MKGIEGFGLTSRYPKLFNPIKACHRLAYTIFRFVYLGLSTKVNGATMYMCLIYVSGIDDWLWVLW